METIGDKLRQEMGALKLPDWFEDDVVQALRRRGRRAFICARHINGIGRDAFPLKYDTALRKWAEDNGINVHEEYNSYGVRKLVFTL